MANYIVKPGEEVDEYFFFIERNAETPSGEQTIVLEKKSVENMGDLRRRKSRLITELDDIDYKISLIEDLEG